MEDSVIVKRDEDVVIIASCNANVPLKRRNPRGPVLAPLDRREHGLRAHRSTLGCVLCHPRQKGPGKEGGKHCVMPSERERFGVPKQLQRDDETGDSSCFLLMDSHV